MKNILIKSLSIFLSIVFVMSVVPIAYADEETTTAPQATVEESTTAVEEETTELEEITEPTSSKEEVQKTLEEQRADLEERQKKNDELLAQYQEDAEVCLDYINALDEKIGYINEDLNLLDGEISQAKSKMKKLKVQIDALAQEMAELKAEYDQAKAEIDKLNDKFQVTYEAYCLRLRAMYISGSNSMVVALLTSKDLSQFFGRYAMIKAIAKSDTQLLKEVNSQIDEITTKQDGLNEKRDELTEKKDKLDAKQKDYNNQLSTIERKQKEIASKKVKLSEMRAESDALYAEYTKKTQMYSEFRNEDEELIKQVDQEISDLINGLIDPEEATTIDATEQTTSNSNDTGSTDGELYSHSNAVLNLTYPVPKHHGVSASFGYYSNGRPHTGIDYPCPVGSKVVAAQKGIVITVKRLNYSYGYYVMIYHGTDAKGRKIVTLYAHNSSILVSVGQSVSKGQQIAKSGSTGNSTGPHSHFELIINGTKTNAKNYLA